MDDLFDEWGGIDWGGSPNFDLGGLGYDIGAFDLGGIDLGGIDLGNFDWGNVDFGMGNLYSGAIDLGDLKDFGFDLNGVEEYSPGLPGDLSVWGADVGYQWDYPTLESLSGAFGTAQDDAYRTGMAGYGETGGGAGGSGGAGNGRIKTITYDDGSTQTIFVDDDGEETVIDTTDAPPTDLPPPEQPEKPPEQPKKPPEQPKQPPNQPKPPIINQDNALLMALLGGLLGLLSKGSAPKLPVGYQGGIPKYTATRVPGRGVEYTRAAQGGLMGLKQGQYLDGATDGMADKIQTSIDGKQPARLSHGEFVIPADVVSHLGNGNSDAGADVLYEMMAKVRKARTGTPKQGKQINPRKMIPA